MNGAGASKGSVATEEEEEEMVETQEDVEMEDTQIEEVSPSLLTLARMLLTRCCTDCSRRSSFDVERNQQARAVQDGSSRSRSAISRRKGRRFSRRSGGGRSGSGRGMNNGLVAKNVMYSYRPVLK